MTHVPAARGSSCGVPFAIGQWADRKPENALRTLFSPFSLSVARRHHPFSHQLFHHSSIPSSLSHPSRKRVRTHVPYTYTYIYIRSCTRWRGRKYLISAESRKSQHRAFCVIKPRPQKLYAGYKTFVSTHHPLITPTTSVLCAFP